MLWRIAHRAVAVNLWRGKISPFVVLNCPICDTGEVETVVHCFWSCLFSQRVWQVLLCLLSILLLEDSLLEVDIHWHHAILEEQLEGVPQVTQWFWVLIRGATLWQLWNMRNRLVF
jgi:hypothetical protein